jgi:hypothetical protein
MLQTIVDVDHQLPYAECFSVCHTLMIARQRERCQFLV